MALLFEGRRMSSRSPISLKINAAMALGAMVGYSTTDPDVAIVAAADNFVGHLNQEVVAVPTAGTVPIYDTFPGYYPRPQYVGYEVTVTRWDEFSCEGTGFLLQTGTNHVANNTAAQTLLTIDAGVFRLAIAGDVATHKVLKASAGEVNVADIRLLIQALDAQVRIPVVTP